MSTAYAVTVQLSENQKRQLGVEMQKSIQDGHYGAAYTYLYNNYRPIFLIFFSKLAGSTALFRVRTL